MTTTTEPRPIECEHEWPVLSPCPECGVDAVEAAAAPLPLDVELMGTLISEALDYTNDGLVIAKAVAARLSASTGRPAEQQP
jgi:hypothetical protein